MCSLVRINRALYYYYYYDRSIFINGHRGKRINLTKGEGGGGVFNIYTLLDFN